MEISKLIKETIGVMSDSIFEALKGKLIGEYITFSILDGNMITKGVFSEKMCEYFEKIELKNSDGFDKLIAEYLSSWDDIVEDRIVKETQSQNEGSPAVPSRAGKYYSHAENLKESRSITVKQLTDYARIMMCLYMSIIEKKFEKVEDFEFSSKCMDIDKIVGAMRKEKASSVLFFGGGAKFDTSDLYSMDTGVFVLSIILYYHIRNNEIEGEY